jgi:hypothetical protein
MAITRAQQVRQMLKEGTKKPAMQGGGPNYLGKQPEVTVPRRWKSSPDHPDTELAYITEPEKKVLIALNMHGGLEDGKPNKGPKGVISLQGDLGGYDASPGGKDAPSGGGGNEIDDNRQQYSATQTQTGVVKGGGKKTTTKPGEATEFRDKKVTTADVKKAKARYNKQFFDRGIMPPLGSRPVDFKTRLAQKRNQGILNFINRNIGKDLYRSGFLGPDFSTRFLGGGVPTTGSLFAELQASYNPDLLENEINLFDEDSIREIASVLSKTKTGITGVQASALENLRKNIKNREELKEQGMTQERFEELYPPPKPAPDKDSDPCLGPNPPAYCFTRNQDPTPTTPVVDPIMFRFLNRGGMVEDAPVGTGIMDLEAARQMMFLGGIAKGIKKGLKSVTRAAKKVFKSPFGKAALLAAPFVMGGGAGSFFGKGSLNPFLRKVAGDTAFSGLGEALSKIGLVNKSGGLTAGGIGSLFGITSLLAALQKPKEDENFDLESYYEKEGLSDFLANLGQRNRFLAEGGRIGLQEGGGIEQRLEQLGGDVTSAEQTLQEITQRLESAESNLGSGGGISGIGGIANISEAAIQPNMSRVPEGPVNANRPLLESLAPPTGTLEQPKAVQPAKFSSVEDAFADAQKNAQEARAGGFLGRVVLPGEMSFEDFSKNLNIFGQPMQLPASGGLGGKMGTPIQRAVGLAKGGKAEPVAKKTMPLLDLDGQEMDFRAEGGFVPIGRMEKADDVPARLSKNEFVFTADAVRNAGDGDIDKGAEVMYNMMKNLEAGGEVSEESQGLDGARKMFQTAQRLEGVM